MRRRHLRGREGVACTTGTAEASARGEGALRCRTAQPRGRVVSELTRGTAAVHPVRRPALPRAGGSLTPRGNARSGCFRVTALSLCLLQLLCFCSRASFSLQNCPPRGGCSGRGGPESGTGRGMCPVQVGGARAQTEEEPVGRTLQDGMSERQLRKSGQEGRGLRGVKVKGDSEPAPKRAS